MLATQIRERTLSGVIGQDTIVKGLKSYFKEGNLPSTLFFIGNSGSGKNTLANIVASTLVCDNPIKEADGSISPCNKCPSCMDIFEERLQRNVMIYNGSDLTAEAIRKLESELCYSTMDGKPRVIIINEAQLVKELKRLLEIIETNKKDLYFIFTSTDKAKFSSMGGTDNKSQETKALRSRGAFFNIKPIEIKLIKDYLFNLLEKFDPNEKIPDTFLEEGLQVVAENSKGNIRQAINDFMQCIASETYSTKEVIDLLGYFDEKEYSTILYGLCLGNIDTISQIQRFEDVSNFYNYSWKILNDVGFRIITGQPFAESWKEKTAKAIMSSNNFDKLLKVYEDTNTCNVGYFNDKVFMNKLYQYFKSFTPKSASEIIIKKKKLPV